jgi:POT family proton-dependent oligopeptide transporter
MAFDIINLVAVAILVYALFGIFGEGTGKAKTIWSIVGVAAIGLLAYKFMNHPAEMGIEAPIFQQFNPFYVVALTPVSLAIFGGLAKRKKEPSAPRKIAYGMLVAGAAYVFMALCSVKLLSPAAQELAVKAGEGTFVNANVLIVTYLILTFGELLLSPMGISFVSKVAPPQYKGAMMGLWFVATALGNILVSIGGFLWGDLPLWLVWAVFVGVCLVAAVFMFSIMKKLEDATK